MDLFFEIWFIWNLLFLVCKAILQLTYNTLMSIVYCIFVYFTEARRFFGFENRNLLARETEIRTLLLASPLEPVYMYIMYVCV